MAISAKIQKFMTNASFIRKMFEEGVRMRREFGAENVFDFSLGNPILEPPPQVHASIRRLLEKPQPGLHRYMSNAGFPEVRERIAAYLRDEFAEPFEAADLVMTTGAAGALNIALKSLLDPGDQVVVVAPFFPEYRFYVDNHGGELRVAESAADFDLDLASLEAQFGPRTKAVLINSPNNPTGRMYSAARLTELGALLAAWEQKTGHTITLLSDDPYRKLVYDGARAPNPFAAYPDTVLLTSHSKDLGLAGERIGYAAISPRHRDRRELTDALTFVNRTLGYVNAPALFQRVAAETQSAAVDIGVYQALRDRLCAGLADIGYRFTRPQGAFYVYPQTPIPDDQAFIRILQKHRVLAVPGCGFARTGHMRLSYSVSMAEVEGALEPLRAAFQEATSKR
ncbi:MAG TPA: pyridoxal phosphate-dependent aminotransferase [Myxococcota bacterium]|nr:pyridoxal phosphate-dependent aminotransferase [Myxococcota bacterium]HRY94993.1 pyridoxal phosphate-dependent aminotransferase [Myxococcota bacterium]HSA22526.1 pyridoxal phosphate-dependent aminotransferase [Myxococcota bacterium]